MAVDGGEDGERDVLRAADADAGHHEIEEHEDAGAHLHEAPGGRNGDVVIPLTQDGSNPTHWSAVDQPISAAALTALDAGATGSDKDFYEGKVAAASFFARNVLPKLAGERVIAENIDDSIMSLSEAAF